MASPRATLFLVLKLAAASLLAGLLLATLGVTPADLLEKVATMVGGLLSVVSGLFGWAGSYMLLGALVVVPVWLLRHLWKKVSRD